MITIILYVFYLAFSSNYNYIEIGDLWPIHAIVHYYFQFKGGIKIWQNLFSLQAELFLL
jgi:hypothetical protein